MGLQLVGRVFESQRRYAAPLSGIHGHEEQALHANLSHLAFVQPSGTRQVQAFQQRSQFLDLVQSRTRLSCIKKLENQLSPWVLTRDVREKIALTNVSIL